MFLLRKNKKGLLCGIYSENEFHALIEHERKRSDRTGARFSMVVFGIDNPDGEMGNICRIPDFLVESVRSTDAVGWFGKNHIGVSLIDTPPEGAHEFMKKIFKGTANQLDIPHCHVYSYPSHHWPGSDDRWKKGWASDWCRQMNLFEEMDSQFSDAPLKGQHHVCMQQREVNREAGSMKLPSGLESNLGFRIPVRKRSLDVLCAFMATLFLLPLLALIAIAIKIVSPGPVFFRQERIGYLGRHFTLFKFCTMKAASDTSRHREYARGLITNGNVIKKLDDDSQVIPFGKLL